MIDLAKTLAFIGAFGLWGMHIYRCIQNDDWLFLITGAVFSPLGIYHGLGILVGWW